MKPSDLNRGDVIRHTSDGKSHVVIAAFPEKVTLQHTVDLFDLTGWQKESLYGVASDPRKAEPTLKPIDEREQEALGWLRAVTENPADAEYAEALLNLVARLRVLA